jgi:hypothetical protein
MESLCKICNHTHKFEDYVYSDCPWCSCLNYVGESECVGYFRAKRVRSARRRYERESSN